MPTASKSRTITKRRAGKMAPLHPGEMLREEFVTPMGLTANRLALALHVPSTRISEILNERRGITADTALRLERYFNMSAEFWMRLQAQYDLESAQDELRSRIRREVLPATAEKRGGAAKSIS